MAKYLKLFETHAEYEQYVSGDFEKPNVSHCEDQDDVHYNPMPVIIATDDTNLPLMNIARTYGWVKQDATEFYESEANDVTDIIMGIVNTFVNTHTQETVDTQYGTFTLDLWYDKYENKWYDATELLGEDDFTLANLSLETIRPIKSQDGETASLYGEIDWTNIEHFNEFKYFTSVTSIGDSAFQDCSGLTSITIPDSVISIGDAAFQSCSGLSSITIPDSVTSIGENAFYGCRSLPIVDNIRYADTYAIEVVDRTLTTYTIKSGTKWIGEGVFYGCTSLKRLTIPSGVISIGNNAFAYCHVLTSVTIPNSVTSIGDSAFQDCSDLTSVTSLATTAPSIQSGTFRDVKTNGTLTVPTGSSGYDVWMGTGNYYLGKYGWTKVEQ